MTTEFWRMGATPVPVTEIGRLAREMEQDGWDGLAVGEAHGLLPDPYVALGLAAAATTTLKVGTAVAVPLRDPVLAASAMATVQGIAGGTHDAVIALRGPDQGGTVIERVLGVELGVEVGHQPRLDVGREVAGRQHTRFAIGHG